MERLIISEIIQNRPLITADGAIMNGEAEAIAIGMIADKNIYCVMNLCGLAVYFTVSNHRIIH